MRGVGWGNRGYSQETLLKSVAMGVSFRDLSIIGTPARYPLDPSPLLPPKADLRQNERIPPPVLNAEASFSRLDEPCHRLNPRLESG